MRSQNLLPVLAVSALIAAGPWAEVMSMRASPDRYRERGRPSYGDLVWKTLRRKRAAKAARLHRLQRKARRIRRIHA